MDVTSTVDAWLKKKKVTKGEKHGFEMKKMHAKYQTKQTHAYVCVALEIKTSICKCKSMKIYRYLSYSYEHYSLFPSSEMIS